MYQAIEESFTCQFVSMTAKGAPVALPVYLNHFNPDTGTFFFSSPLSAKRIGNVRRHPQVAVLFSPAGSRVGEPTHVLLVQGLAKVEDTDPENGWKRYFAGWARRQPSARASLPEINKVVPGYTRRAIIRVEPARFLGWPEGMLQDAPEIVEVNR